MTMKQYVVAIPMGTDFEERGGDNDAFFEAQRALEVWLQIKTNGGFRWNAAGDALLKADILAPMNPPEELRLFAVPGSASLLIEISTVKPLTQSEARYPLARWLRERGGTEADVHRILAERPGGVSVLARDAVQLAPQYLGPAAFVVLADFGDGPLKVATFESREHVDEYRQDCWDTERAPTTPAIEVPPAFRHDRKELLVFLETVVGTHVEAMAEPEAKVHTAAGPTP